MELRSLHCPDCGAPAEIGASRCTYCGAFFRPAEEGLPPGDTASSPILPPSFPSAPMPRDRPTVGRCPVCRVLLLPQADGDFPLDACGKCGGFWMDAASFDRLCLLHTHAQRVNLTTSRPLKGAMEEVAYHPCPVCHQVMDRHVFAGFPGLILNTCREHGTWFLPGQMQVLLAHLHTPGGAAAWAEKQRRDMESQARLQQKEVLNEAWESPQIQRLGALSAPQEGLKGDVSAFCQNLLSEAETEARGQLESLKERWLRTTGKKG